MKIQLASVHDNGSGLFVAYLDDGTSFMSVFNDAPVDDKEALILFVTSLADQVVVKMLLPTRKVHPLVKGIINVKVDAARPTK